MRWLENNDKRTMMIKTINLSNYQKLIDSDVNSKAMYIYNLLLVVAEEIDNDGIIRDFNINKVVRLMKAIGVDTATHKQVATSLKELENIGLVEYAIERKKHNGGFSLDKSAMHLKKAVEHDANNKFCRHVRINPMMLSKAFYDLSKRAKKLFTYVYSRFNANLKKQKRDCIINILKRETNKELKSLLKVNRNQKIRDVIEEIKPYINAYIIKEARGVETYRFTLNEDFIRAFDEVLLSTSEILSFNSLAKNIVSSIALKNNRIIPNDQVEQMLYPLLFLRSKHIKAIIKIVSKFANKIKHPQKYMSKVVLDYFSKLHNKKLDKMIIY